MSTESNSHFTVKPSPNKKEERLSQNKFLFDPALCVCFQIKEYNSPGKIPTVW